MNIKFKVWDSEEKCFVDKRDGFFVVNCEGVLCTPSRLGVYPAIKRYASVFSTGQTDKNEVEIYEGDIMPPRIVVSWLDDNNEGLGMNVGWYLQRDDFESWAGMETQLQENTTYEVIGNKYENPELLET